MMAVQGSPPVLNGSAQVRYIDPRERTDSPTYRAGAGHRHGNDFLPLRGRLRGTIFPAYTSISRRNSFEAD